MTALKGNRIRYIPRLVLSLALTLAVSLTGCDDGSSSSSTEAGGSAGSGGSGGTAGSGGDTSTAAGGGPPGWVLSWSDEFDQPDGSKVDDSKWTALIGGEGWGNQELEYYTDEAANAHIEGGALHITATPDGADQHQCWYGTCQYTSARLQTKAKFEQHLGRFEARIQVPQGQGIWPAFWMLGNNIDDIGWPTCGEIDIMENIGKEPAILHGSLHGPGYSGGQPLTGQVSLEGGGKLADEYHLYTVEWEADAIRFYLDDELYETQTPADVPGGAMWVFDHPFFMLLNVAVGGSWPGSPDGGTVFPQSMKVDYVRVYQRP